MRTCRNLRIAATLFTVFSSLALGLTGVQAHSHNGSTCGSWKLVAGPTDISELSGVASVSSDDVWAVGWTRGPNEPIPLIEHWNGKAWSAAQAPSLDSGGGVLTSISADSNKDV